MNDPGVVVAAVLVALSARLGWAAPLPLLAAVVALAALRRNPTLVAVALVMVVGVRSDASSSALDAPLPDRVVGTAQLVSDPEWTTFGTSVEVRIGGRRWQAGVERADEWVLRPLLTGDHVVLSGRPRAMETAPEGWRRSRHLAGRLDVTRLERGPPAAPWFRLANSVHRLLSRGADSFDVEGRALFLGLVVGDDRAQSDVARFRFQASGLRHLLAVSGQNVAFVLLLARPLMRRWGLRAGVVVAMSVLAVFVLVTRAEASVLRASALAAVALIAGAAGRVASGARILSLAIIGLLLVDPLLVEGLGFQLSVCATVGLLVGVRALSERLRGPVWFRDAVACTLAAQLATAPLLIGLSGGVPSVATVAHVLAVPAAGAVMVLGLTVGLASGLVVAPVAAVAQLPTRALLWWINGVASAGSHATLPLLGPGRLAAIVTAGALLLLRSRLGGRPVRRRLVAVAVAVLVAGALRPVTPPDGAVEVIPGVVTGTSECGRTVSLERRVDVIDALTALQELGVVEADVVIGPAVSSTVEVAEQLMAQPVLRTATAEVPCTVTP